MLGGAVQLKSHSLEFGGSSGRERQAWLSSACGSVDAGILQNEDGAGSVCEGLPGGKLRGGRDTEWLGGRDASFG